MRRDGSGLILWAELQKEAINMTNTKNLYFKNLTIIHEKLFFHKNLAMRKLFIYMYSKLLIKYMYIKLRTAYHIYFY